MEQEEQWPADIDDLIEFLPHLEDALHQLDVQFIDLSQQRWNEKLSKAENYARTPGLKRLHDLCARYDQQIASFPAELSARMHALPMAELLRRRKAYSLTGKEYLECAYENVVEQRMRALFSNLTRYWEPEVRRGEFAKLDRIDFQAIIQNLREWYAFMRDPQNERFLAHDEPLGSIPEYIKRFEAVRDAVAAAYDMAFMQATHTRLGATADVKGLGQDLLRDIARYSSHRTTPRRAPWI
jgi:hypothetical protein